MFVDIGDSTQVEVVERRIAKLEVKEAEVQKKLDSAERFVGRWRMSSQQLEMLNEEKKLLFQHGPFGTALCAATATATTEVAEAETV